ncbi:DEAD/DEAH box helicase family protein [Aerococcaceae bacterium DSM 111022]|nr:DEAD/DEAH box helicase family protein [Aerococcaceae bacterium DSM 111022]
MNDIYLEKLPTESVAWGRLVTEAELMKGNRNLNFDTFSKKLTRMDAVLEGICTRCSNSDPQEFGELPPQEIFGFNKARRFCLKCQNMSRMTEGNFLYYLPAPESVPLTVEKIMTWEGTLSPEQSRASKELIAQLGDTNRPHMIHAVTGAGKTEMIFPVIETVLRKGGRVVVASPRIDVCLELAPRLQEAFKEIPVQLLYGGQDEPYCYTPLTVSTTHQLLRFKEAFDLIIVDEVDAFPYEGDETLHYAVKRSLKKNQGKLVYLTATPDKTLSDQVQEELLTLTTLPARYHRSALPEPHFEWIGDWREGIEKEHKRSKVFQLIQEFFSIDGVKLFFVPSIRIAEKLFKWLQKDLPEVASEMTVVHAKDPERKEKVQGLRDGKYQALITTTILERGVTFTNCHVCIIGAEDRLYTLAALVQMSGRVGRKFDYPTGHLVYAHGGITHQMIEAKNQILEMNRLAKEKGLINEPTTHT